MWGEAARKRGKKPRVATKVVKDINDEQSLPKVVEGEWQEDNGVGKIGAKEFLSKPAINNKQDKGIISESEVNSCKIKGVNSE